MIVFFAFVIWFWLLITVFADSFRRHDTGGGSKTLWIIFVIGAPYLGVFIYLFSQGQGMAERNAKQAEAQQAQFDAYVQSKATTTSPADQIAQAKAMLDAGTISQTGYDQLKAKALA